MPKAKVSFGFYLQFLVLCSLIACGCGTAIAQVSGGAAISAIDEKAATTGGRAVSSGEAAGRTAGAATPKRSSTTPKKTTKPAAKAAPARTTSAKYDGTVVGDKYTFLNFEIVSPVQPIYTNKAKAAGALGLVQVEVLVDQDGSVLSARARTGNVLLHPEAEAAALATRFNRPTANGRPARALGFVVYRFGTEEQEYEQEQKNKPSDRDDGGDSSPDSVVGGVLNGKAVSLPKPPYPPAARAAGASGQVWVQVEVDETGKVTSATANSGHPLLRKAAEDAARSARFSPSQVNGKPVKVTGILVFIFTPPRN